MYGWMDGWMTNESDIKSTNLDELTIIKLMFISLGTSFYSKLARYKA